MTCCKPPPPLGRRCSLSPLYPCTSCRPGTHKMHGILLAEYLLASPDHPASGEKELLVGVLVG